MDNTWGSLLRTTTFGESHGPAVGVVVDGLPAGLPVNIERIQADLDRRRPGQNKLTTQRREADRVRVLSGVFDGRSTGSPLALLVENTDQRSNDYDEMASLWRPSHADLAWDLKFGFRDHRGGGRSSARETVARVAAGSLARDLLKRVGGTRILAWVEAVGKEEHRVDAPEAVTLEQVENSLVRCPDPEASARMERAIQEARSDGDSVGGIVRLWIEHPPAGCGEPVFDRVEALLAHAMLSLPATKGFEIGSGFAGTRLRGTTHNDAFVPVAEGGWTTGHPLVSLATNRSGGVQGGIAVGAPIDCRVAFKPTATVTSPQLTVDRSGRSTELRARGRHDPCVVPRAVVIVEAMAALVLADLFLRHRARHNLLPAPEFA